MGVSILGPESKAQGISCLPGSGNEDNCQLGNRAVMWCKDGSAASAPNDSCEEGTSPANVSD